MNSENKKDQQLAKAKAWEAEMKRKCKPMKPVALGCLWLDDATLNLTLKQFAACLLVDGPINVESSSSATSSRSNEMVPVEMSSSTNTSGALYVPDEGNKYFPDWAFFSIDYQKPKYSVETQVTN